MSQYPCAVDGCLRSSRVLCYCCTKNYCSEHLKDHNDMYIFQLDQLTNEINQLAESCRGQYRQQLDRWRHESHQRIDEYYEKKCHELNELNLPSDQLKQNQQVIQWIQIKIAQLIREQNITQQQIDCLKAATNAVQRDIAQIPRENIQLSTPSLVFDDNFIQLEKTRVNFNLHSTVSSLFLTKALSTDTCIVMASSAKFLLIGQPSHLCLYDQSLNERKQVPWRYAPIWDMCLLESVSKFLLVCEDGIFTFDQDTMTIAHLKLSSASNKPWYCCACSEKSLFLATQQINTETSEYIYTQSTFSLKGQQKSCSSDEYIEHMKCSSDVLALIILNDLTGERRLDLRSISTSNHLWTISLNIQDKLNVVSCCSLNEKGWLIVDLAQNHLIHVTNQGQIEQSAKYPSTPQYATQFGDGFLAILTEQGINLHKIE